MCLLLILLCLYVFFFSSRRRHTRWPRDWSSDVCFRSSGCLFGQIDSLIIVARIQRPYKKQADYALIRSEERRVGKERRFGVSSVHSKRTGKGTSTTIGISDAKIDSSTVKRQTDVGVQQ